MSASPAASVSASRPSPRLTDPRWVAAADDDPLEKARLADAVGAAELLEGVEEGGSTADIALAALPYAADAELSLGRLGELARVGGPGRRKVLAAILGVAGLPRRQREALDPEGARRCGEVLLALSARAEVPREERALAVSAARALSEKGFVDSAKIPAELDPPGR